MTEDMNMTSDPPFDVVEASIRDLSQALAAGRITAVELVAEYLQRISHYDTRNTNLNSIPVLNTAVFTEAAASDDRRAAGRSRGLFDGIPYTVKDSYKVHGMTVASGSSAFQRLFSNEDALTVQKLREAGAMLMGKTNMPPMAAGGMQRGVYGRAESPYNATYLAAAFASGSSNGCAVSTAASFAAFGMGEETVSSGRSPASNNGLVAYTPSRGLISIRGNWPLYPTCDVVVPHTRTMDDLLDLLDVIAVPDQITTGDFWRDQPFVKLPEFWTDRPTSFRQITSGASLRGLRIAVPEMYIGGRQPANGVPIYTSPEVLRLWERARSDLEALGATVIITPDFPLVTKYETLDSESPTQAPDIPRLPKNWNTTERGTLIAHAWDDFLRNNQDPHIPSLLCADLDRVFPAFPPTDPQVCYSEPTNAIHWSKMSSFLLPQDSTSPTSENRSVYAVPHLSVAVRALEALRAQLYDQWLSVNNYDMVVFPAAGDVGRADADVNHESGKHAWRNGVKYSNGNRALRHLGVPTVTVPMGMMDQKNMPVGLTFCGRAYEDVELLGRAYAFERARQRREVPRRTPRLSTSVFRDPAMVEKRRERPVLRVQTYTAKTVEDDDQSRLQVEIEGTLSFSVEKGQSPEACVEVFVDAKPVPSSDVKLSKTSEGCGSEYKFHVSTLIESPPVPDERNKTEARIARDKTMLVLLARDGMDGKPDGWLGFL